MASVGAQSNLSQSPVGGSSTQPSTAAISQSDSTTLSEIVVTAQKREEKLKDVPISMSVLSGNALDQPTAQNMAEVLGRVAGVTMTTTDFGGESQITMRGASTSGQNWVGSNTTAFYVDGVPFGLVRRAFAPDMDLYDLNRVEVLRGPQGTLYGANALSGVVRVLTNDADLDNFGFKVRTTESSTDGAGNLNYGGDMAVNVPIVDGKLAARLVVSYSDQSGWIDSPDKKNVNDADLRSYRLKVAAKPIDDLTLNLTAWSTRNDYGGRNVSNDANQYYSTVPEPVSQDYDVYSLDGVYSLPGVSISSTSSYFGYKNESDLGDYGYSLSTGQRSHVFTEELLIRSTNPGPWRWSVGGFFRDDTDNTIQALPQLLPVPEAWTDTSKSEAIFGEISRRFLADRLELTVGLRGFHDLVGMREDLDFFQNGSLISREESFHKTTPRVVLTGFPSQDLTVYVSYSEGYRSGFPQLFTIYSVAPEFPDVKPDTLKNYEIGAKGDLWNRLVSFDAALYFMDWRNAQQADSVEYNGVCCFTAPINAPSASGLGVDMSLTVRPIERLEVGVDLSENNLSFNSDVVAGANNVVLFSRGERLNFSPQWTAGAFADYVIPLGAGGYNGRLSTSANYVSQQHSVTLNTTQTANTVLPGDPMFLARASFAIEAPTHWNAILFVNNLTNSDRRVIEDDISYGNGQTDEALRVRPRTIGLQVEYKY
jgi:iron complex outermembrane receptor protein